MVELGQPGDHQGVEEPALRCRAPPEGRRKPGGTPGGVGSPRGPREGPQVSDPGGGARQGAGVASLPGRGGSALHHGHGRQQLAPPGPCAAPSPTGATACATRRRHSPSPPTSSGAGDGSDTRYWGGELGPPFHAPPKIRCGGGARATSRGREGGDNGRGGGPTAPQPANR